MIGVSQKAIARIRRGLFKSIQRLPVKYQDTHTHGDLMSRFTNDLDSVGVMLNSTMSQIFSGTITLIGTIVLMFVTNWILAIVTIVTVPLLIYAANTLGKMSRRYYSEKVFCQEETAKQEFEILSDDLREKQIKAQFFGGIMGPVMGNLSQISYALSATSALHGFILAKHSEG